MQYRGKHSFVSGCESHYSRHPKLPGHRSAPAGAPAPATSQGGGGGGRPCRWHQQRQASSWQWQALAAAEIQGNRRTPASCFAAAADGAARPSLAPEQAAICFRLTAAAAAAADVCFANAVPTGGIRGGGFAAATRADGACCADSFLFFSWSCMPYTSTGSIYALNWNQMRGPAQPR